MPTLDERKFELKQKRSDALMAKINVLRARDGSIYPPIQSMKEEDNFNLGLLFGQSRNENITWSAMGVEGLIRCYYEIIYKLNGYVRNNIIRLGNTSGAPSSNHNTSCRSGLQSTVDWLSNGVGWKSGFYIGWDGLDVEINDTGNSTTKQRLNDAISKGRKGDFDVPMTDGWVTLSAQLGKPNVSSSFTDNRDTIQRYNSELRRVELVYPDNHRSISILGRFDTILNIIGVQSPLGPHIKTIPWGANPPPYTNYINNTLLGKRFTDIHPYEYESPSFEIIGGSDGDDENPPVPGIPTYTDGKSVYGNGTYDFDDIDIVLSILNTNLTNKYIIIQHKNGAKYCIWFYQNNVGSQPILSNVTFIRIDVKTGQTGIFANNDTISDIAKYINNKIKSNFKTTLINSTIKFHSSTDLIDLSNCLLSASQSFVEIQPPSGYSWGFDFWDSNIDVNLNTIINNINDIINFINFTKITNYTYIVNHKIIPGIDPVYNPKDPNSNIGSSWNLQNDWINQLIAIKDRINQSLELIQQNKETNNKTKTESRNIINNEILQIKSLIPMWQNQCINLANTINNIFGDISNPLTLYGHRFLWIRTLIHPSEGSLTAVNSTEMAIDFMNKKLKKSEEELYMFGITEESFIPIPIIVGVEPYPVLNQATFEMEIGGWLVAWAGQEHCIGYDVWKSDDYDPSTKIGTWKKIEASNTQYTISDINTNNGKVFTYIIDSNVDPIPADIDPSMITHPYYKVKAYDYNGGTGDYARKNASSDECDPMNPAAFPFGGQQQSSGPRKTPTTKIIQDADSSLIPPNTLFWVTNFKGSEASDFERKIFRSEAPFDSIASNLIVFVDGRFKNKGLEIIGGDYELIDTYTIRFHQSIQELSEVNLVVALRSFASKNKQMKDSIDYYSDLLNIIDKSDGDIYKVEKDPANTYWQWSDESQKWNQVSNPDLSNNWKDPVNTFTQLPTLLNSDGDIRLVLDTSILYSWNGSKQIWVKISGSTSNGWLAPVDTPDDLEDINSDNLINGAIVFVLSEESLYRWNITQNNWVRIAGSNSANWKNPVNTFSQLPKNGNSEGDIRLILSENKMYRWYAWDQEWKVTKSEADLSHDELSNENWEIVDNHDARYYPKNDIDHLQIQIDQRLSLLESLKPKNAEPLHGNFAITGTKLYEGFLSEGTSILRYDTLKPGDYFRRILKDANFIMSNTNTQQFKDADKGILYCYINNVKVDEFDLGSWFDEDKRETGQTYPRQFGINNIIEILSVGPYNQYATYQRADFQLNIKSNLLVQGENKIKLIHEVMNQTNDIHNTDDFIIFWDNFNGKMGFKEIFIDEIQLNSNKYLSGIRYYSIGDKIRLRFMAENLFNNTYVENKQLGIILNNFAINNKYINFKNSAILGYPAARIGETINYLEELTINIPDIYNAIPVLQLEATNPFETKIQTKNNTNLLINTINYKSDDINELFVDEYYRLPVGNYNTIPTQITGIWNSQQLLTLNDLQIFNNKLIYPYENFSKYKPVQIANYSSFSGVKYYYRAFKDIKPHNNGKFIISGFNKTDPNIKIDIKLPGLTGWMQLNKLYNAAIFSGIDGDGCLITNNNESYEWTSGGFSTANSGYMIIIRISMFNKTNNISNIKLEW